MSQHINRFRILQVQHWLASADHKCLELPNDARRAFQQRLQHWRHHVTAYRDFMALHQDLSETEKHILSARVPAQLGAHTADKRLWEFCEGILMATAVVTPQMIPAPA